MCVLPARSGIKKRVATCALRAAIARSISKPSDDGHPRVTARVASVQTMGKSALWLPVVLAAGACGEDDGEPKRALAHGLDASNSRGDTRVTIV